MKLKMEAALHILDFGGHSRIVGSASRRALYPSDVDIEAIIYDLYKAETAQSKFTGGVAPENYHFISDAITQRKAWYEQQAADNPLPLPPMDTRSPDGIVTALLTAIGDSISSGAVSESTVATGRAIVSAFASDQVSESEASDALQGLDDILRAIKPYASQPRCWCQSQLQLGQAAGRWQHCDLWQMVRRAGFVR